MKLLTVSELNAFTEPLREQLLTQPKLVKNPSLPAITITATIIPYICVFAILYSVFSIQKENETFNCISKHRVRLSTGNN